MSRPRGVPNKATKYREQALSAKGIVPLDFMLQTLRDETQPHDERMKAAVNAAPYVHPRLASTTTQLTGQLDIRKWLSELDDK